MSSEVCREQNFGFDVGLEANSPKWTFEPWGWPEDGAGVAGNGEDAGGV